MSLSLVACNSCRRRKTKCDHRPKGCSACVKNHIPCRYLVREVRSSRCKPRGPYKKGKTPREKELEELLKCTLSDAANSGQTVPLPGIASLDSVGGGDGATSPTHMSLSTSTQSDGFFQGCSPFGDYGLLDGQTMARSQPDDAGASTTSPTRSGGSILSWGVPEIPTFSTQLLELWEVYKQNVDPIVKLLHCPSFSEQILLAARCPASVDPSGRALIFSICYASINVLAAHTVKTRFQQDKAGLASTYLQEIKTALKERDANEEPSILSLQAMVLHLICLYRNPLNTTEIDTTVFAQALEEAMSLCVEGRDDYVASNSFLETQLRRRCWWALYALDYHWAAKVGCEPSDRLRSACVPLPLNLNDIDLSHAMDRLPKPRAIITDMSYPLLIFECARLSADLRYFRSSEQHSASTPAQEGSIKVNIESRVRVIEQNFLHHCETSRDFDWLLLLSAKMMLNAIEIQVLELDRTSSTSNDGVVNIAFDDWDDRKFALVLDIIECWQILDSSPDLRKWSWYTDTFPRLYGMEDMKTELSRRPASRHYLRARNLMKLRQQEPDPRQTSSNPLLKPIAGYH